MTPKIHDRKAREINRQAEVEPTEVIDPYASNDKIIVMRQIRNDPLGRLHSHRQIDDAQLAAGRAFQNDRELAERGAKAIDPSKEAVDGGRIPEPITDRQIKATKRLLKIERDLGRRLMAVLEAVLIKGSTIEQLANSQAQSVLKLHGALFRVALHELAEIYGFANGEPVEEP